MAMVNMTVRVEPEIKERASDLFRKLGLDLSVATRLFLRQALRCRGLPFELRVSNYEDENTMVE